MGEVLSAVFGDTWYEIVLRVYGFWALPHILIQYARAIAFSRSKKVWLAKALEVERTAETERAELWATGRIGDINREQHARPREAIAAFVPAFQESLRSMRFCLEGIVHQIYLGPLVTVVVDDGSYLKDIARLEKLIAAPPEAKERWRHRRRKPLSPVRLREREEMLRRLDKKRRRELQRFKKKRERLLTLCQQYADNYPDKIVFIPAPENKGKRYAHKIAHDWVLENFDAFIRLHYSRWVAQRSLEGLLKLGDRILAFAYLTVDSDTWLYQDACEHMVRTLVWFPKCGAATGYVDIRNYKYNWLARMVDWRYWSAFNVERQAQGRRVLCCSGPLAMYRASVLDDPLLDLMRQYVYQYFLGVLCTFGDDRRMTNLFLRARQEVRFVPEAHCLTYAPVTMGEYERQQTRWNMSFYREMLWSFRYILTQSVYGMFDMLTQFFLPFMLIGCLGITGWLVVFEGRWLMALQYIATVVGIGLLRSVYGAFARKEWMYLLFSLYGFVYLWLILKVRTKALYLLGKRDTSWKTRLSTT